VVDDKILSAEFVRRQFESHISCRAKNSLNFCFNCAKLVRVVEALGRYQGDPRTARQIIADEKRASITRKKDFPSELLDKTFDEIDRLAKQGSRRTRQSA